MVYLATLLDIRADFLTEPERMLFIGIIVAVALFLAKLFVPYLNGWVAVFANVVLTALAVSVVFGIGSTWASLAVYLCIVLIAAGIHGCVTKLSDYPNPGENPTPSGTPRQNYDRIV